MSEGGTPNIDTIKIVLLGESTVGKTALRQVYTGEQYQEAYRPTLGVDYSVKEDVGEEGRVWKWQICDLAGTPNYRPMRSLLYPGAEGAILVYDLGNPASLTRLHHWIGELYTVVGIGIPLLILGNKIDLQETETPCLMTEQGAEFVNQLQEHFDLQWVGFIETSAKTPTNVVEAFNELKKLIQEKKSKEMGV
ncbi:MAG: Rab family GTPase [Candidatus Hermodarchaeota archaeon]